MTSARAHTLHDVSTGRRDAALILASHGPRQFVYGLLALGILFLLAGALRAAYDLTPWPVFRRMKVGQT